MIVQDIKNLSGKAGNTPSSKEFSGHARKYDERCRNAKPDGGNPAHSAQHRQTTSPKDKTISSIPERYGLKSHYPSPSYAATVLAPLKGWGFAMLRCFASCAWLQSRPSAAVNLRCGRRIGVRWSGRGSGLRLRRDRTRKLGKEERVSSW